MTLLHRFLGGHAPGSFALLGELFDPTRRIAPVGATLAAPVLRADGYGAAVAALPAHLAQPADAARVDEELAAACADCSDAFRDAVRAGSAATRRSVEAELATLLQLPAEAGTPAQDRPPIDLPRWQVRYPAETKRASRAVQPRHDPYPVAALSRHSLPGRILRSERHADQVIVVSSSQALAPTGEVSAGGYWIILSHDRGRRFDAPLYTGLRALQPYRLEPTSSLPLLRGGRVQLAARTERLDTQRLNFPPRSAAIVERRDGLILQMDLADLRRDSDGDGLSDLTEYALTLDPSHRDSDGDGLADGDDTMPNLARADTASAALQAALAELLPEHFGADTATRVAPAGAPQPGSTPLTAATFLVADPGLLAPLAARGRIIVLSPAQVERLRRERGVFLPIHISLFVLDRRSRRGLLVWSARWTGGQIELHHDGQRWIATPRRRFVT